MDHILETFFFFFFHVCPRSQCGRMGMVYQGVSMAIRGNVSRSLEFRPGKVPADKQNEKVSSLAGAIPYLFSHPSPVSSSSSLQSRLQSASSILLLFTCFNTSPCYLYLRLQMPSLSSSIILHLLNFPLVLLFHSVFDMYCHLTLHYYRFTPPLFSSPSFTSHL